jgi:hypothetical protein
MDVYLLGEGTTAFVIQGFLDPLAAIYAHRWVFKNDVYEIEMEWRRDQDREEQEDSEEDVITDNNGD